MKLLLVLPPLGLGFRNISVCVCMCVYVCVFCHVWLIVTPWTVAHQALLSMEFSRQGWWNGLPFPTLGDLPDPGIDHVSLASSCIGRWIFHHLCHLGNPQNIKNLIYFEFGMTNTICKWASEVVLVVKNLLANAGDIRDTGSVPGSGWDPGGGNGNPLQYSCLENPMDRGAWWAST